GASVALLAHEGNTRPPKDMEIAIASEKNRDRVSLEYSGYCFLAILPMVMIVSAKASVDHATHPIAGGQASQAKPLYAGNRSERSMLPPKAERASDSLVERAMRRNYHRQNQNDGTDQGRLCVAERRVSRLRPLQIRDVRSGDIFHALSYSR